MVHLNDAILSEESFIFLQQQVEYLAVGVGVPAAIRAGGFDLHAGHRETTHEHRHHILLHILAARTGQDLNAGFAAADIDDGEVGTGLYDIGIGRDETDDAIVAGEDGIYEIVLNLGGHLFLRSVHILDDDLDALWLDKFELVVERILPVGSHLFQCSDVLFGQGQHGLGLEGDGVAHVAAIP